MVTFFIFLTAINKKICGVRNNITCQMVNQVKAVNSKNVYSKKIRQWQMNNFQ
jgi:hypothetical protein